MHSNNHNCEKIESEPNFSHKYIQHNRNSLWHSNNHNCCFPKALVLEKEKLKNKKAQNLIWKIVLIIYLFKHIHVEIMQLFFKHTYINIYICTDDFP